MQNTRKVTITSDNYKLIGDVIDNDDPKSPKYPAGVGKKDLNQTSVRSIKCVDVNGEIIF